MQDRLARILLCGVTGLALTTAVACSREAEPGQPAPPAPPAPSRPAPNLGEYFALGQYEAIVDAAPEQLAAAREGGASSAECWEIEHVYLLALAHTGPADRLVECWRDDSIEFADMIPSKFMYELFWHARSATGEDVRPALLLATSESVRARWQEDATLLDARGPFGHSEGFPKAWLAPDERPDDR